MMTNTKTTTNESLEQVAERMAIELAERRERALRMFTAVREMKRRLDEVYGKARRG